MKITKIKVYKLALPLKESSYKWSHNSEVKEFDNTIVKLETDSNIFGFGEVCTLGSAYLPAYARGVRSGIKEIGKSLLGLDPTDIININQAVYQDNYFLVILELPEEHTLEQLFK